MAIFMMCLRFVQTDQKQMIERKVKDRDNETARTARTRQDRCNKDKNKDDHGSSLWFGFVSRDEQCLGIEIDILPKEAESLLIQVHLLRNGPPQ